MKKTRLVSRILLIISLIVALSSSIGFAEDANYTEVNLIGEDSGYKLLVPNFIRQRDIGVDSGFAAGEKMSLEVKTPVKNSDGSYTIFEIVTTDDKAHSFFSGAEQINFTFDGGSLGNGTSGEFKDNKATYSLRFYGDDGPERLEELILVADFLVYDKDDNPIFSVIDVNFTFSNEDIIDEKEKEATADVNVSAIPTNANVLVNGSQTSFNAYNINGNNYLKLRDLAYVVNGTEKQFQVEWNQDVKAINLISNQAYISVGGEMTSGDGESKTGKLNNSAIYKDGKQVELTAYTISDNNFFKLRDIAEIFDIGIDWDNESKTIKIDTTKGYIAE